MKSTPPNLVMWLDPGKLTGVATYTLSSDRFNSCQGDLFDAADLVEDTMRLHPCQMAIGWEHYIITGKSLGTASYSLEMIGVARRLAHVYGVEILKPMPSSARKLGDDTKLKALGWYVPGRRHANDAANHVLSWLLREGRLPPHQASKLFTSSH